MIFKLGFLPPKPMILYLIVESPQEVERGGEVWGLYLHSGRWKIRIILKFQIIAPENTCTKGYILSGWGTLSPNFHNDSFALLSWHLLKGSLCFFFKLYIYIYIFFFFWLTFIFQEHSHAVIRWRQDDLLQGNKTLRMEKLISICSICDVNRYNLPYWQC